MNNNNELKIVRSSNHTGRFEVMANGTWIVCECDTISAACEAAERLGPERLTIDV